LTAPWPGSRSPTWRWLSSRDAKAGDAKAGDAKAGDAKAGDAKAGGTAPDRAATAGGMLAVAGNAHTPTRPTSLGVPLGARLARQRPGVRDIRIEYGSGHFYNLRPRRFHPQPGLPGVLGLRQRQVRLHLRHGSLIFDLPEPTEAIVPHRPTPTQIKA